MPQRCLSHSESPTGFNGALSDCWILSALAILAAKTDAPKLLKSLIVSDKYAAQGIYVMRFYKNGQWRTVMIDDTM